MKKKNTQLIFCCMLAFGNVFGQEPPQEYYLLVQKAFLLYESKDYKNSALTYSSAFKTWGWKGLGDDRYNAACSWSLAGNVDSSFFNLTRIVTKLNYSNYNHITTDSD